MARGVASSRGVGQYVASETHRVVWPLQARDGRKLLVYVQGSHGTADTTYNAERADIEALAEAGYVVALCDLSQTTTQGTFGNGNAAGGTGAQGRIAQLQTFMLGSDAPLTATGPMRMVAGSGGVAAMLNYARANPSNVAAMVGIGPLVDLEDLYENRTDGSVTQAEIDTAYGGDVTTSYATHNPSAPGNQAALADIPLKLYYSTDDPYIPAETVTNYQSLYGANCEIESLGAIGHSDAGVSYANDVAHWLWQHRADAA